MKVLSTTELFKIKVNDEILFKQVRGNYIPKVRVEGKSSVGDIINNLEVISNEIEKATEKVIENKIRKKVFSILGYLIKGLVACIVFYAGFRWFRQKNT